MRYRLPVPIQPLIGLALCIGSEGIVTAVFASRPSRMWVPFAFVFVLVLLEIRYGTIVGVLGSIIAAAIFACFLYPPMHSFRISDAAARSNIAWMLLAGVALSYLLAGSPQAPDKKQ